jgi:hypothetical protein
MGYEAPTTTMVLHFEDHPGLVVRAKSVPIGVFTDIAKLADVVKDANDADLQMMADTLGDLDALFSTFGAALVEWNVEIDGEPVPASYEGVKRLDAPFAMELVFSWMDAIGNVDAPLGQGSSGGGRHLAASLQMEPPSSRAS